MAETAVESIESKLSSDYDGSYKSELIQNLENHRDKFATAKQGLLPPEEYDILEKMEGAVSAAITVIKAVKPAEAGTAPAQTDNESIPSSAHLYSI